MLLLLFLSTTFVQCIHPPFIAPAPPKVQKFSVPGGARAVRVHQTQYADIEKSDSVEEEFSDESELAKADDVISLCLKHNTKIFDEKSVSYKMIAQNISIMDKEIYLIENPTASHINHKMLHPSLYRNVKDVGSLDDFAALIGAPRNWMGIYQERVVGNLEVLTALKQLKKSAYNASEAFIQDSFSKLVHYLSVKLGCDVRPCRETQVIVGGIAAREEFDIRGNVDPYFLNSDGQPVLATEVKTDVSFGAQHVWYHKSCATQIFSALFAFNCPTFLITQRQWKLFVENSERTSVLTFPYNSKPHYSPHLASTLVQPIGATFLQALTICLLAKAAKPGHETSESDSSMLFNWLQDECDSGRTIKKRLQDSEKKLYPGDGSGTTSPMPPTRARIPAFQIGEYCGQPVYRTVRVVPQETVRQIEDALAGVGKGQSDADHNRFAQQSAAAAEGMLS